MFKWEVDPIEVPPPPKGKEKEAAAAPPPEDETLAAKRRFFAWLGEPLARMSKDLGVPRDILLNLAAKEGGWTKGDLDHNMPLNNPFGFNRIENGKAVGNIKYNSVDDAVKAWVQIYGERVRGVQTREEFVQRLQHPTPPTPRYNSADPKWEEKFMGINVKKWREKCGIPE